MRKYSSSSLFGGLIAALLVLPTTAPGADKPASWKTLEGHTDSVYCVDASPDGKWFASGGFDQVVRVWDSRTGKQVRSLSGHTKMVLSIAFTPDSSNIVSSSLDNLVKVWPTQKPVIPKESVIPKGKPTPEQNFSHNYAGHQSQVYGVAFSPDAKLVASCGYDKSIKLWDLAAKREIRSIPVESKTDLAVYGVAFSLDGKSLLASYSDGLVRQFETETGKPQRQLAGAKGALYSLSLQKQGTLIAAGGLDKAVYLWKAGDGQLERSLAGHDDDIYRVQFNPAGTRLLSLGYSGQIRVWDLSTGKPLLTAKLPALLFGGCYTSDGRQILAAASDQKIYVVELPSAAQ